MCNKYGVSNSCIYFLVKQNTKKRNQLRVPATMHTNQSTCSAGKTKNGNSKKQVLTLIEQLSSVVQEVRSEHPDQAAGAVAQIADLRYHLQAS